MPVFDQYKAVIEGFTYHVQQDVYHCWAGKILSFRKYDTTTDGHWLKIYWADCADCQRCPLKPTCVPGAKRKQLTRTVFGNLLHYYGLRRLNVRGHAGSHKTKLITAVAYNLRKLLKYRPKRQLSQALAQPRPLLAAQTRTD